MYEGLSADSRSSRRGDMGVGPPESGTSSIHTLALLSLYPGNLLALINGVSGVSFGGLGCAGPGCGGGGCCGRGSCCGGGCLRLDWDFEIVTERTMAC
jgi:hypothetical protein